MLNSLDPYIPYNPFRAQVATGTLQAGEAGLGSNGKAFEQLIRNKWQKDQTGAWAVMGSSREIGIWQEEKQKVSVQTSVIIKCYCLYYAYILAQELSNIFQLLFRSFDPDNTSNTQLSLNTFQHHCNVFVSWGLTDQFFKQKRFHL